MNLWLKGKLPETITLNIAKSFTVGMAYFASKAYLLTVSSEVFMVSRGQSPVKG